MDVQNTFLRYTIRSQSFISFDNASRQRPLGRPLLLRQSLFQVWRVTATFLQNLLTRYPFHFRFQWHHPDMNETFFNI